MSIAFVAANRDKSTEERDRATSQTGDMVYIKTLLEQSKANTEETKHTVRAIEARLSDHAHDIVKLQESDKSQWTRIDDHVLCIRDHENRIAKIEHAHDFFHGSFSDLIGGDEK